MSGAGRRAALAATLLAAAACTRVAPLELLRHDAGPARGTRLNEPIVLEFSAKIDPGSVRAETIRVVRARDGAAVAGRLSVNEASVTFAPKVACRPDLSDGGFQPDERYRVEVPGLPRIACVRSLDGALLDGGAAFEFTTVAAARDAPAAELFVDANPGVGTHFQPSVLLVDGRARLRFSKPLDPRTVPESTFRFHGPWSLDSRRNKDPLFKATLVENDSEAVIELTIDGAPPLPLEPGEPEKKRYRVDVELESSRLSKLREISGIELTTAMVEPMINLVVAAKEKKENP